ASLLAGHAGHGSSARHPGPLPRPRSPRCRTGPMPAPATCMRRLSHGGAKARVNPAKRVAAADAAAPPRGGQLPVYSAALCQHAIERQARLEAGLLQPSRHLAWHVAPAGEPVRAAGVVEQPAALAQYARELVVEGLRVQLASDAEARRVVQD